MAHLRALGSFAMLLGCLFGAAPASAQYFALGKSPYPLEFYDIDFSSLADDSQRRSFLDDLHYIPLPFNADSYLSLGGEVREQYWTQSNESHALRTPVDNSYDLQRVVADAYLHFDSHVGVFAQVARDDAFNKINYSTTDDSRGRVQQGFVSVGGPIDTVDVTAHVGRQEITLGSGRFVWINDSSNVRTTHDGARVHAAFADGATIDLVASEPVTPTYAAFDDWSSHAGSFGAAYLSEPFLDKRLHVDEYYFYRRNPGAQYAALVGNEDRDTLGGRLWGAFGSFKFDADFAYQYGSFDATSGKEAATAAAKTISAYGTSARGLYTFESVALAPGVQFQTSYFSGSDNPKGRTLGTFAAPFPRPTVLNYAGLETLENLIEAYPSVLVNPARDLILRLGPESLWRANVHDAVYVSRSTPLTKTLNDDARYIGTNLIATAEWRITPSITAFTEFLHEIAGPAITRAGGHGANIAVVQLDVNF
jgi:hypothetical protein